MIDIYTERKDSKDWIFYNDLYFNLNTGNEETGTVYSDYAVIPFDMNKVKVFDENGTRVIEDYEELKEWWNNEE